MLTLTSTLFAAQKQASSLPYVRAVFSDYHGDVSRIRFCRHYTGSEGDYFSAVIGAGDGSLVRARIDPTTHVLYTQRVTSPGPSSTFSSWTSQGTVSSVAGIAIAAFGSTVWLFYVHTDDLSIRVLASANNGASWSALGTVLTASTAVGHIAAAFSTAGDAVVIWSEGSAGAVFTSRWTSGGGFGSRTAWTNSAATITGLATQWRLDFNLVVCGTETTSGDAKVWAAVYGDGVEQAPDDWGPLIEVTTANANSNVSFRSPALEFLQHWRLFFMEKYTGTHAYSRLQWSTMNGAETYGNQTWREPVAFNYEGDYGVAATARNLGGRLWLSSPAGVWSGLSPSLAELDVSADVVEATVELQEGDGRARIVLRNDPAGSSEAGRFAGYGAGALAVIQRGTRLQLAAGYQTGEGLETPVSAAYWVESIEQTTGPSARLIVHARDAWWLLERWRAKRQFLWPAGTRSVFQILQFVGARAGLSVSSTGSSSDALTELQPAFTIHPGQTGRSAVESLLAMVPELAFAQAGTLKLHLSQPDDEPEYSYVAPGRAQTTEHAMVSARYRDLGAATNRVRVLGAGVFAESFDFAEAEAVGERTRQVLDLNLTTVAEAADRAESELAAAGLRARRDEIRLAGVNCGQELYDVVSITDPQAGLEDVPRRVLGLSWRCLTAGEVHYDMTLTLGDR